MRERRSEVRMLCADLVWFCWKDPHGKRHRVSALLEDISECGICLQTETPIPVGTEVSWQTLQRELTGMVRYCEYRQIGYFVGVELNADSKWSRSTYRPQHLLDLKRLMLKSSR